MGNEGGRSRTDREAPVSIYPSSNDLPNPEKIDSEILASFQEFSPLAKDAARQWILLYIGKLVGTSYTFKEIVGGNTVSDTNVNEAAYSLIRGGGTKLVEKIRTIGGIFLGAGLSLLFSAILENKFTRNGMITIAAAGIIGTFLCAVEVPQSILRKWRKHTPSQPARVRRVPPHRTPKTPKE